MKLKTILKAGMLYSVFVSPILFAQSAHLVVNKCLADKLSVKTELANEKNFSLIMVDENFLESVRKLSKKNHCGGFFNVSHLISNNFKKENYVSLLNKYLPPKDKSNISKGTYKIKYKAKVERILKSIIPNNIWVTLTHLTSYDDRAPNSSTGVDTAYWLKRKFETMANDARRMDTLTYFVKTGSKYKQPSVVTVIGKDIHTPAIVIGAHMDTYRHNKPGADDDGSGSAILMEIARVLIDNKVKIKHPIYLIWYAAEEPGMVGSQFVVQDFIDKKIPVKGVMQLDGAGYRHNNESTVWLIDDMVDKDLTRFVETLFKTYAKVDVGYTGCGYACSDHASWTENGFASTFPYESKDGEENPYYHTSRDTMEYISLEHMVSFTKAGIAFALELALEAD